MSEIKFSSRVDVLLAKSGTSQKQLSESIGVKPQTFNGYMTGYRDVPVEILMKVADYFGVTTDYLLGRTDEPH